MTLLDRLEKFTMQLEHLPDPERKRWEHRYADLRRNMGIQEALDTVEVEWKGPDFSPQQT